MAIQPLADGFVTEGAGNTVPLGTKDRIFQAAVFLFAEKGFNGTSMRDIARRIGLKESSLYNHFRGKNAIFEEIMEYQMDAFRQTVHALDELGLISEDIIDPVEFWLAGLEIFLRHSPPLMEPISRILQNEMLLNKQCGKFCLHTFFTAQSEVTEAIFKVMHQRGMIRQQDFHQKAKQYVYMLQGLEMENKLKRLDGVGEEEIHNVLSEQIAIFIREMK